MAIRYFEFIDSKSKKFWQIEQHDLSIVVTYGRMGNAGTEKTKNFDSEETLLKAIEKLILEKIKKGYIEIVTKKQASVSNTTKVEVAPLPTTLNEPKQAIDSCSKIETKTNQKESQILNKMHPANVPPWFKLPEDIIFDKSIELTILPNRQNPAQIRHADLKQSFSKIVELLTTPSKYSINTLLIDTDNTLEHLNLLENTFTRIRDAQTDGDLVSDAVLYALAATIPVYQDPNNDNACIVEFLIAKGGLAYAIDVFLKAQTYCIHLKNASMLRKYKIRLSEEITQPLGISNQIQYSLAELSFADWLSFADDTIFKLCETKLINALDSLHSSRQPLIALLLSDNTALASQIAHNILTTENNIKLSTMWLSLVVTDENLLAKLTHNSLLHNNVNDKIHSLILGTWFNKFGNQLLDIMLKDIDDIYIQNAKIILAFGVPDAIKMIAKLSKYQKVYRDLLVEYIDTNPLAYFAAFTELTVEKESSNFIKHNLEQILQQHVDDIPLIYPWVSDAVKAFTETLLAKYLKKQIAHEKQHYVFAKPDELPKLLTSPPWLSNKKMNNPIFNVHLLDLKDEIIDFDDSNILNYLNDEYNKARIEGNRTVKNILKNAGLKISTEFENNPSHPVNQATKAIENNKINEMVDALGSYSNHYYMDINVAFTSYLDDAVVLALIENCHQFNYEQLDHLLYRFGTHAINSLVAYSKSKPSLTVALWQYIASTQLAPIVAKAFRNQVTLKKAAIKWCLKFPEYCIVGILPHALGKKNEAQKNAHGILRFLAQNGYEQLILEIASRYQDKKINHAILVILNEDPLDLYPNKINTLPSFWQPVSWHRPRLKNTNKVLDDEALAHIGTMLQFPSIEGIYEGINVLKNLCDTDSLADFAWDLFHAWQTANTPAKDNWAFKALGLLGNDDSARKLDPLIRQWPGEGAHQRSVLGLDVLEGIGSDVALMVLNGIAIKVKFKGIQDKAKEKIAEIADKRNLSIDELEDRLAPTLGLGDNGILILDFGPRQFKVSFDETLKPFVRNMQDVRLKDLPKPNQTDDQDKSTAAINRFKALKKDAKLIAIQEIHRLEKAMCQKRRWDIAPFIQLLVKHPLVRHLVCKLVWGVYEVETDDYFGGQLVNTFRVAEDGTFTDRSDAQIDLPSSNQFKIGIPHIFELSQQDKSAFGQLFADYEIIQPFQQLDRETYILTEEELQTNILKRFDNAIVPSSRIMGLKLKGWVQGQVIGINTLKDYFKPLKNNLFFRIKFSEGIYIGALGIHPEQKITECMICNKITIFYQDNEYFTFSELDEIDASEIIRDMMYLTAKK